jgi:fructose-1,6-bisphosphatase/inositol monophosphatase family enzyme
MTRARNDTYTATRGRGAYLNERGCAEVSKRLHLKFVLTAPGFRSRSTRTSTPTWRMLAMYEKYR